MFLSFHSRTYLASEILTIVSRYFSTFSSCSIAQFAPVVFLYMCTACCPLGFALVLVLSLFLWTILAYYVLVVSASTCCFASPRFISYYYSHVLLSRFCLCVTLHSLGLFTLLVLVLFCSFLVVALVIRFSLAVIFKLAV